MCKRNGSIDFWKFIFSLVIMSFHSIYFAGDEKFLFYNGANMVEFFFLVSGFLMAESVMKQDTQGTAVWKSTWRFLFHKIKGMCPEYYVAWAVSFVIKNAAGGILPLRLIGKHAILSIWELFFLRMTGFNDYNANGATWYISAMLYVMLIFLPLFFVNKGFFLHILAPIGALSILGSLYASTKVLRGNTDWMGFCYKVLLRAAGVLRRMHLLSGVSEIKRTAVYVSCKELAFLCGNRRISVCTVLDFWPWIIENGVYYISAVCGICYD